MLTPLEKLKKLGIVLPTSSKPVGKYLPIKKIGCSCRISGQLPIKDGVLIEGSVESECTVENAQNAAKICVINMLAQIHNLGDFVLDSITEIVEIRGYVNSDSDFTAHPLIIDAASEFLLEVFGEKVGSHTRIAVGVNQLPGNAAVEIAGLVWLEK